MVTCSCRPISQLGVGVGTLVDLLKNILSCAGYPRRGHRVFRKWKKVVDSESPRRDIGANVGAADVQKFAAEQRLRSFGFSIRTWFIALAMATPVHGWAVENTPGQRVCQYSAA